MDLHSRFKRFDAHYLRCALHLWQQLWREYYRWIRHNPAPGCPGKYADCHRRHTYATKTASADRRCESSSPVWASRRFDGQVYLGTAQQCRVIAKGYQGSDKACLRSGQGEATVSSQSRLSNFSESVHTDTVCLCPTRPCRFSRITGSSWARRLVTDSTNAQTYSS